MICGLHDSVCRSVVFFFFKQKTAYELRISDWSSDVCSSDLIFLDGEAIVLDKPSGLPVDPPRDGSISLENHLESLTFGFQRWPQAVHRLDRDTSGCLLLARNPKAHKRFQRAFEEGRVEKR